MIARRATDLAGPAARGPRITQARRAADVAIARALFEEYASALGVSLCFQGFAEELKRLPGGYAPPLGRLLLGYHGGAAVGCVALRPMDRQLCELKRLYVREEFRRSGLGRELALACIEAARAIGYRRMRLDTLPQMGAAVALYESLGFKRIEPYRENPIPGALYFELAL